MLERLAAKHRFDPYGWTMVSQPWGEGELRNDSGPREWQAKWLKVIRDHLNDPAKRYTPLQIAIASGHGIGKSAFFALVGDWAMSCWPGAKIVVTANTSTQMETKTSPEFAKWFRSSITAPWFDVMATSIKAKDPKMKDQWRLDFVPWTEHNTEAFQGLHNSRRIVVLMMDEGSAIHDKVWEVAEGALTDPETVLIWIVAGNPTRNSGRFRECFRRFRHRWLTDNIDSRTVFKSVKNDQLIEDLGLDDDQVKIRVLGQFPLTSDRQFISGQDIDAAFGRHLRKEQYNFAPIIIGVDPAWTGADEFVIYGRQGLYSNLLAKFPKNDNDIQMAGIIARFEDELNADAVFVDAGFGTGIVSAGNVMGRAWRLVWFGSKAIDPGYYNKRTEMWGLLRDWLKQGGAIPPDEILRQDLSGPELMTRLDGKKLLESKEDMREKGLPSPNRADALALTFAAPVAKKRHGYGGGTVDRVETAYNPYE